jgi:hypothetical protein
MRDGTHYGVIPGCGDKPALLKPGAEKICLTFHLTHEFDLDVEDFGNGHRQYTVNCRLRYRDGTLVGQGIGVCSTMESKYRYRWDNTGRGVPKEYWNSRDAELLGGHEYTARKVKDSWIVFRRVEHDNPADYYNTCAKMAKKRAHVDATLSATAASDIFEQDIEDGPSVMGDEPDERPTTGKPTTRAPQGNDGKLATEAQLKLLRVKLDESGLPETAFLQQFRVDRLQDLPFASVNDALAFIKDNAS